MKYPFINKDIGNPMQAFPRYQQIVKDVRGGAPNDYYGTADRLTATLASQPGIGRALEFAANNPAMASAALAAGAVANNLMGNPIGGAIDFITLDNTNFKPNDVEPMPMQQVIIGNPQLAMQPGMVPINQVNVREMNEEERKKFMDWTTRRTQQQLLTQQALEQLLNSQPGMEMYE